MIKRIIILSALVFMLASCGTLMPAKYMSVSKSMMNTDENMKKVELGMTQEQVISAMGKRYEIIGARENMVILGYKSYDNGIYKLFFVDEKLIEWNKEWIPQRWDYDNQE